MNKTPSQLIGLPEAQGMYDPRNEHDACGIGFVANIKNKKSHKIISQGLEILRNLTHRGAVGADPLAGDGAGILIQMPDAFMRAEAAALGVTLPAEGEYAVGFMFLSPSPAELAASKALIEKCILAEGQLVLGWRDVPVNNAGLGESVKPTEPKSCQIFIGRGGNCADQDAFERKLMVIRKQCRIAADELGGNLARYFYVPSFSSRTLLYKGMLLAEQVGEYYLDLRDERMVSGMALIHQRFSTNTFPTWSLSQPFRMVCHNGEINTLRGNINWMAARRHTMRSTLLGDDLDKLWPLIPENQSDSACFDNALELLVAGGYSLAHAMMMLIPEAWAGNPLMDEKRRAFYEYHAALMEPWDGPAAMAFTDGRQIGATLDRNGLRPARYFVTKDDMVVMASEMGVLPVPEEDIIEKWRLQPGKMLLIDLEQGRIISDAEIKETLASRHPYQDWLDQTQCRLEDLPAEYAAMRPNRDTLLNRQQVFGYTQEDLKFLMSPMAETGEEAVGSMGTDTPISPLSSKPKLLYTYFKQLFAQVTNPPIDPIREELVMSLVSMIGPLPNLLDLDSGGTHRRLEVRHPILTNEDLEKIRHIGDVEENDFRSATLDTTFAASTGAEGMGPALNRLCTNAEAAVLRGENIIILSDRKVDQDNIPIPALLACAAVHHHLIRAGLRTSVGIVVESGEPREVHHFCTLAGYGAQAINPYLALQTISEMQGIGFDGEAEKKAHSYYIKAICKGILKVMSKMGISTYQSYCGAQIFDAVGLSTAFVEKYFTRTNTAIEGVGINVIAKETVARHTLAYSDAPLYRNALDVGGDYAYRIRGEHHAWTPETVSHLQHAVRAGVQADYDSFARLINDQNEQLLTPRGMFEIQLAAQPVPIEEVEPAAAIVKRFATGAMSYGSISREAHTNLAIAMNRIGGRSNTGEGGEEPDRYVPLPNGDSMRSAIKQVASGRFGVTTEYLVNSDMMQIKMAQGAKPGEGGQLPGHKVDKIIGKVRHSTPGVGLISPPPHHDIYSIEDLAQLIYDLKNVNPDALVSVKLVSEIGVGTIAAGVSKARADHVTISGFEGGTGASPLTSLKHAGSPWEIGLAETHQTLVLNRLRGRIAVQVDGGIRTGRDVVIGALLGADEFGFATAPLIASGCIMMRKCHLNTCPVGVATQDPELRKRFTGQPEHVINYFFFVAEEVRTLMASLGFRTFNEMVGRSDLLRKDKAITHWKAQGLDFSRLFHRPPAVTGVAIHHCETQNHNLENVMDRKLIEMCKPALEEGKPVSIEMTINNTDRTTGAMLSGALAKRYGHDGLPDDTIRIKLKGTSGQSFGAFVAKGITLSLEGQANDYVGKGLSGGRLIIYPARESAIVPERSIIVGNTVLYGAISGECYFRGVAGERFAVRNSGAYAVVEGAGDHCCEYMTGGVVLVIGQTGRNFAAGMSGGIAYVLDEDGLFDQRCNTQLVELSGIDDPAGETVDKAAILADPLRHDTARIQMMLQAHASATGSSVAQNILANWAAYRGKFVKIVPYDYRRALLDLQKEAMGEKPNLRLVG